MKKKKLEIVIVLLLFVLGLKNLNAQMLLKEISLKNQIDNSSLVVEGTVISKKSFWDTNKKNIYTANTIQIHKVFKGERFETIEIITKGGAIGLYAEVVTPSLKLNSGEQGIFMLYGNNVTLKNHTKTSKVQFKPYGSVQGFYKYNLYNDQAVNPFSKKKGIAASFYSEITTITKSNYVEISSFDIVGKQKSLTNKSLVAPSNITFSPTIATAGTKTVLTINGTGFGGTEGKVLFSKADDGGATFIEALSTQILVWSNVKITVEIPSQAGTGKIRVVDNAGASATSIADLTISYSESNVEYDADDESDETGGVNGPLPMYAYRVQHINDDTSGGYTWQMFTDFNLNTNAKAAFLRALDTWRCETGINWVIGSTNATDAVARDNINIIRFDNGDELEANVLGQCTSYYNGCVSGNTFNFFVSELDIVFDDAVNWNFNSAVNSTAGNQLDFESVVLHELGHGHQLSHVNNTNDVMNFSISLAEEQRILGSSNKTAANTIQSRSTSTMVCLQPKMTNHPCFLSVDEEELKASINIYPNPASNEFNIKNTSLINLDKVIIYDISGRLISQHDMTNSTRVKTISLLGIAKGVYFIKIYSERAEITRKILIE